MTCTRFVRDAHVQAREHERRERQHARGEEVDGVVAP